MCSDVIMITIENGITPSHIFTEPKNINDNNNSNGKEIIVTKITIFKIINNKTTTKI